MTLETRLDAEDQRSEATREEAYLPLSMLNHYAYCPRRFWLIHVQGEMVINAPVLEGTLQHERVHTAGQAEEAGEARYRRLYVWSDRLALVGFTDLVEERGGVGDEVGRSAPAGYDSGTRLVPVEYKHGRVGRWENDHFQLCAQALCLEERTGRAVPAGEIFYWGSRRRVRVALDAGLRARTETAVVEIAALLAVGRAPLPAQPYAKCRECSLEPVCLPREVNHLQRG